MRSFSVTSRTRARPPLGVFDLLQDVVAGDALDAVTVGQRDSQCEHAGALDGVINRGRKRHLLGAHAEIIPHHGFDLRLDGFGPHTQGKFRDWKTGTR